MHRFSHSDGPQPRATRVEDLDIILARLKDRVGARAPAYVRKVEPGALIKFARATGQMEAMYVEERYGPIAAPTYLSTFCSPAMVGLMKLDLPLGMFLHTDDVCELGVPISGGDIISTSAELVDVFLKQGRKGPMLFQVASLVLTNQRGEHAGTLRVSAASFK